MIAQYLTIGVILIIAVAWIVKRIIRRRKGGAGCGCGCDNCPSVCEDLRRRAKNKRRHG